MQLRQQAVCDAYLDTYSHSFAGSEEASCQEANIQEELNAAGHLAEPGGRPFPS